MKTVRDVTKISGVNRRTLQYYDEIGLLKPDAVKPSGYRLYSESNLERLWRILFYRELDFSLEEIRDILDRPPEVECCLMKKHKKILIEKQHRLDNMIKSIDQILEGQFQEDMLNNFDTRPSEETKKQNQKSADRKLAESDPFYDFLHPLITYKLTSRTGLTSMIRNIGNISNLDWENLRLEGEKLGTMFVHAMSQGSQTPTAMKAVHHFKEYIGNHISSCDESVLLDLADLYLKEVSFIDKTHLGLAQFVSDALRHYCSYAE